MNKKDINKNFKKFNIPEQKILKYENPKQFANQYKKCTILEYGNTFYSDSSYTSYKNTK
ncbi:hypothetical protein HY745_13810 [Candidatus Desantisbacteria bacterium]|nr:hypothetical protein [Candidatus Desantisbacteria bacterium]